jgi:N-acetylmuramoyl-L-alanine amidase
MGASGAREDELNLKVAQCLKSELEGLGAQIIMTRSDNDAIAETKDEDMAERRRISRDTARA